MLSLHRRIRVTQGRDVFLSSPVISSGRVFVAYPEEDLICLDAGTLTELWRTLPRRAIGHVQEWRQAHVAELEADWARARAREPLLPIEPLE